jgi:ankyrin repeat protein
LHWSAFHGSASGAKCLLEVYGVSAGLQDVKDKEGKTPLQHAKDEANDDVVKIIEEICANAGDDKGLADKDGIRKRK